MALYPSLDFPNFIHHFFADAMAGTAFGPPGLDRALVDAEKVR